MTFPSADQLAFVGVPPFVLVCAALVGLRWTPPEKLRSTLLHFAAGVVFAVVAVEMVPDVIKEHSLVETIVGFSLGVTLMLVVKSLGGHGDHANEPPELAGASAHAGEANKDAHEHEHGHEHKEGGATAATATPLGRSRALILGVGVDLVIDGLVLGIGFTAGVKEGRLLALALATELVALGLATSTTLLKRGVPRGTAALVVGCMAAAFVVASLVGFVVLGAAPHVVIGIVIPFGVAALLFLVTEELLVEAHEGPETPAMTAAFFVGFLLFLVLGEVS